jgi:ABC-2 type transport system permease protein
MLYGGGFGLTATALAVGAGSVALAIRGITNQLEAGDSALLLAGGAAAGALWAAIGVGGGAVVREQVPALIGVCAWLLLIEGLLLGDLFEAVGDVSRFAPGAAAAAVSGQEPEKLLAPAVALVVLGLYAATAAVAGAVATARRDVAWAGRGWKRREQCSGGRNCSRSRTTSSPHPMG